MQTYVKGSDNAEIFEAMKGLKDIEHPVHLYISGPKGSGKTTYSRQTTQDLKLLAGDAIFGCSGADISIALQLEGDERSDALFEKLGARPVLIIDDIAILLSHKAGDFLLSLLLKERDRQNFSTVIFSDTPIAETKGLDKAMEFLSAFDEMHFSPLREEEKPNFVRGAEREFRGPKSPTVTNEAVQLIVEHMGASYTDMENAIHFLMVQDVYGADDTVDLEQAKELFEIE